MVVIWIKIKHFDASSTLPSNTAGRKGILNKQTKKKMTRTLRKFGRITQNSLFKYQTWIIFFAVTNFSRVCGLRSSLGKSSYVWNNKGMSCPYSTDYIVNASCYLKRINSTSENFGLDIFIKPGIEMHSVLVRYIICEWRPKQNSYYTTTILAISIYF